MSTLLTELGPDVLTEILSWLNLRDLTTLMLSGDLQLHRMVKICHVHNLTLETGRVNHTYSRIGGIYAPTRKMKSFGLPWYVSELKAISSIEFVFKDSSIDTLIFESDHWLQFGGRLQKLHLHTLRVFHAFIKLPNVEHSEWNVVPKSNAHLWKWIGVEEQNSRPLDVWLPLHSLLPSLTDLRASHTEIWPVPLAMGIHFLKVLPITLQRLDTSIFPKNQILAEYFAPVHLTALKLREDTIMDTCTLPLSLTSFDFCGTLPTGLNWDQFPNLHKLKLKWDSRYEATKFPKTLHYLGFYGMVKLESPVQFFITLPHSLNAFVGRLSQNVASPFFPPNLTTLKVPLSRVQINRLPKTITQLQMRDAVQGWPDVLPGALRHLESSNAPSASAMQNLHSLKVQCPLGEDLILALPSTVRSIQCTTLLLYGLTAASYPQFLPKSRTLTRAGLIACARKWVSWVEKSSQRSIFYSHAVVNDFKYCPSYSIDSFEPTLDLKQINITALPPTMTQFPSSYTCLWDELPLLPPALKSYRNLHVKVPSEVITEAIRKNGSKIGKFFLFPDSCIELLADQLRSKPDGMTIEISSITAQMISLLPTTLRTLAYRKGLYTPSTSSFLEQFASSSSITRLSMLSESLSIEMAPSLTRFKNLVSLAFKPTFPPEDPPAHYFRDIPSTVTELTIFHNNNKVFQPSVSTFELLPRGLTNLILYPPIDSISEEHLEALPQPLKHLQLYYSDKRPSTEFLSNYRPSVPSILIHTQDCRRSHPIYCYSRKLRPIREIVIPPVTKT